MGFLLDEYNFVPLLLDGEETGYQACTLKGNAYITLEALEELGDCSNFEIDEKNGKLLFYPAEMNVLFGDEETTDFIRTYCGECYTPIKSIKGGSYVSLNYLAPLCGLRFETDEDDGLVNGDYTAITYVDLTKAKESSRTGTAVRKAVGAGSLLSKSPEKVTVRKGQEVFIEGETRSFFKIRTLQGSVCYVNKNDIEEGITGISSYDHIFAAKTKSTPDEKINLVWTTANGSGVSPLPPDEEGIDVVSPVWMNQTVNGAGHVTFYGDRGYVDLCHERGMKVWVDVNNNMTATGSTNTTSEVLADDDFRRKSIAQYLFYACLLDADGLNIDYEDVKTADGDNLTLFMREMSEYTERLGLVLSIDTLIPTPGNQKIYHYEELGEICDYICVMTYDEHYNGSTIPGSVSSRNWYLAALGEALSYCEPEKVLMGIPFYARVWTTDDNGNKLGVYAGIMEGVRTKIEDAGIEPEWDEDCGQYYAEFKNEKGETIKIWIENARSVASRLSDVLDLDLAGSCCWLYGQQEDGIFDIFEDIYHDGGDPQDYNDPY